MAAFLRPVFLWFYCLPISSVLWLLFIATAAFLLLKGCCEKYPRWAILPLLLLMVWTGIVVFATVSGRSVISNPTHNFIPFHSYREVWNGGNPEIYRSNFMNWVLFFPSGLFTAAALPRRWSRLRRILLCTAVLTVFSASLEWAQYAGSLGLASIDDVIHNGLGALAGGLVGTLPVSGQENG